MGDRANVYVKDYDSSEPGVFLYTHWDGSELPETVRVALAREERWDDPPYLARIVFCEMIRGDRWDNTTGYGISAVLGDGGRRIVVLDPRKRTVAFANEENVRTGPYFGEIPMGEYVGQERADWPDED
jgi:hypothetical protein